ncbi:GlsB/YeaQ/YmgE family stress response membrane protein [Streptomyces sp. NPDC051569]|uniref:GlsB/YeaQ/YmgE family stress response membrane protein n=1 Tax=Streptomyces sp. NPDC051569 TaxID=3365661 RepID=UPI0037B12E8E
MNWLWAIVVGLVLGLIAKAIIPGKQRIPLWLTTVFGILGAMIGNALAGWLGVADTKGFDWTRHVLQVLGAVLVVFVGDRLWNAIRGDRQRA